MVLITCAPQCGQKQSLAFVKLLETMTGPSETGIWVRSISHAGRNFSV
jgi:hypothetical protein